MKKSIFIISLLLVAAISINAQESKFPNRTGPYLGQKPPLNEPILFAPGIVSNSKNHSSAAISPDGKEIYWAMVRERRKIWFTKLESGSSPIL